MKVLVNFQPNKKLDNFEGARLRKTIKGALELGGVPYTTSAYDSYDVIHLISPTFESQLLENIDKTIPVVVSALYCESDRTASYLSYKGKGKARQCFLTSKGFRFLSRASLILVPSEGAKSLLVRSGITNRIEIVPPGINLSRFNFSRDDEKEIFYRYFREDKNKKLVLASGKYKSSIEGMNTFILSARRCPNAVFYYMVTEGKKNRLLLRIKRMFKTIPSNVKICDVVPDDVYRSALLNADVFMLPGYKISGTVVIEEAMAARCQIIARDCAFLDGYLQDGVNAYVGGFSETIACLVRDYLDGKLKPTTNTAYDKAASCNLNVLGGMLKEIYQNEINLKN